MNGVRSTCSLVQFAVLALLLLSAVVIATPSSSAHLNLIQRTATTASSPSSAVLSQSTSSTELEKFPTPAPPSALQLRLELGGVIDVEDPCVRHACVWSALARLNTSNTDSGNLYTPSTHFPHTSRIGDGETTGHDDDSFRFIPVAGGRFQLQPSISAKAQNPFKTSRTVSSVAAASQATTGEPLPPPVEDDDSLGGSLLVFQFGWSDAADRFVGGFNYTSGSPGQEGLQLLFLNRTGMTLLRSGEYSELSQIVLEGSILWSSANGSLSASASVGAPTPQSWGAASNSSTTWRTELRLLQRVRPVYLVFRNAHPDPGTVIEFEYRVSYKVAGCLEWFLYTLALPLALIAGLGWAVYDYNRKRKRRLGRGTGREIDAEVLLGLDGGGHDGIHSPASTGDDHIVKPDLRKAQAPNGSSAEASVPLLLNSTESAFDVATPVLLAAPPSEGLAYGDRSSSQTAEAKADSPRHHKPQQLRLPELDHRSEDSSRNCPSATMNVVSSPTSSGSSGTLPPSSESSAPSSGRSHHSRTARKNLPYYLRLCAGAGDGLGDGATEGILCACLIYNLDRARPGAPREIRQRHPPPPGVSERTTGAMLPGWRLLWDYPAAYYQRPRTDWAHWWRQNLLWSWPWNPARDEPLLQFVHRLGFALALLMFNLLMLTVWNRVFLGWNRRLHEVPVVGAYIQKYLGSAASQMVFQLVMKPLCVLVLYQLPAAYRGDRRPAVARGLYLLRWLLVALSLVLCALAGLSLYRLLQSYRCGVMLDGVLKPFLVFELVKSVLVLGVVPLPVWYWITAKWGPDLSREIPVGRAKPDLYLYEDEGDPRILVEEDLPVDGAVHESWDGGVNGSVDGGVHGSEFEDGGGCVSAIVTSDTSFGHGGYDDVKNGVEYGVQDDDDDENLVQDDDERVVE